MFKCRTLFITLALLIAVSALSGACTATLFAGSGTAKDPYLIQSPAELAALSVIVNAGQDFSDCCFLQDRDLDLDGMRMNPIGLAQVGAGFAGCYDGGGHAIRGLQMRGSDGVALFGTLTGTVMNLEIQDCDIAADYRAAALVFDGEGKSARIVNCGVTGRVSGIAAGGLAHDFSGGEMIASWFDGTLDAESTGGLYLVGKPGTLNKAYANYGSGFGTVEAAGDEEMSGADFVAALNQGAIAFLADTALPIEPCQWELVDGKASLGDARLSKVNAVHLAFPAALKKQVNEIFIHLAVLVAIIGAAILLGKRAANMGRQDLVYLATAYLILIVLCALAGRFAQALFMAASQWVVAEAVFILEWVVLISLCVYRLRRDDLNRIRAEGAADPSGVFVMLLGLSLGFAVLYVLYEGAASLGALFCPDRGQALARFAGQLAANRTSQLDWQANYGTIGWLALKALTLLIPRDLAGLSNAAERVSALPIVHILRALLFIAGAGAFAAAVFAAFGAYSRKRSRGIALALGLAISAPVWASWSDCGMSLPAAAFVLLSVYSGKTRSRRLQGWSPLFLAIATGFHPLSAVFALLLILEKRFRHLLTWLCCCVVGLALPLLLYHGVGGLGAIAGQFAARWVGSHVGDEVSRTFTLSFAGTLNTLAEMIANNPTTPLLPVCDVIGGAMCALLVCCAMIGRGWKRCLCLALAVCGASRGDTPAVAAFMAVPLFCFLNDGDDSGRGEKALLLLLFVALFALFPIGRITRVLGLQLWRCDDTAHPALGTLVQGVSLLTMALAAAIGCIADRFTAGRTYRSNRARLMREAK